MKFNNLNLGSDKKSEFTKADVKSTEMKESKEQRENTCCFWTVMISLSLNFWNTA